MPARRVIGLSDNRVVHLGAYVDAWARVLTAPAGTEFAQSLTSRWPATREEILEQFRDGLHDRINRRDPRYGVGRKWDPDWQRQCGYAARELNYPRLVIRWLPMWLRDRFAHRLEDEC